ncbi:MAG: GNAT family N-acetyltransferase [Phototrophicaceae bacterium]
MHINIRKAHRADVPTLAQLVMTVQDVHRQAHPNFYKPMKANDRELHRFYASEIAHPNNYIFIAEIEDQAVGHVLCQVRQIPDTLFTYGILNLHIDQMTVDEPYQGMGVGKALMQQSIEQAQALEVQRMTLGVVAFNQRAIRFYEQFGFQFWSHRMAVMLEDMD